MTGRKVRTKKLNVKTLLSVLTEGQIDATEYDALITETQIATGVDQSEENEYHLQNILKEAGTSNDQEIPVPPPQESEVNYNALYSARFSQPSTYIRFSNTVEESIGCPYDMTAEDAEFLKQYNSSRSSTCQLSEDEFEHIMDVYESTEAEQTPFAAVDNTIIGYEFMVPGLNQLGSAAIMQHAKAIYDYWSSFRKELGNKPLHPSLKFETQQETDDMDPYVCFRRREARQTRKTRARDVQMAEKLKRLRRELEEGRQLVVLSHEREVLKRELLASDRLVFEHRARLKELKVRLGVKGDDEDLFNQKPKRKAVEVPTNPRAPVHLRISVRNESRSLDADLQQLADKQAEKENEWRAEVELKKQNHQKWNQNFIDLTRGPLSPVKEQAMALRFRPATTQYLITPPASASSDSMDIDLAGSPVGDERRHVPMFRFSAGGGHATDAGGLGSLEATGPPVGGGGTHSRANQPAFRRRIGRLNRLWIDRRGLTTPPMKNDQEECYSDRWKYDQDDDEEPPVYELDPFSMQALRFRAMIPLPSMGYPRKMVSQANMQAESLPNGPASHGAVQNGVRPAMLQAAPGAAQA